MDDAVKVPEWLTSGWTNALADAIASMSSSRPEVTWQPQTDAVAPDSEPVWQELSFDFHSAGPAAWLGASQSDARALGALLLTEAGVDDADEGLQEDTYSEVVNQAFSVLARAVTERLGKEVLAKPLAASAQAPPPEARRFSVAITHGETPTIRCLLCFGESFTVALTAALATPSQQSAEPQAEPKSAPDAAQPKGILALLLNIDLSVRIALARTLLPVSDVLRLSTGAIVELHQPIEDPAELIVNDHLLARGRIVVTGGSYGFEVTDVLDRGQMVRLLALRSDAQRVARASNHIYEG
jgi:flagellar motor switch protein FliN